jgi:hypothetical protein
LVPDINDVKWDINTLEKTITLDNVVLDIEEKDYIGQNVSKYLEKTPFLWGFLKLIFVLLFWIMMIMLLSLACSPDHNKSYTYGPYIAAGIVALISYLFVSFFQSRIDKYNKYNKEKFHSSDKYKKEYFEKFLKPNILYNYLKKRILIHSELKDKHQLLESNNFASSDMDVLMSKIYVEAFLLDATGIIINQNNISNEVNGHVSGYVSGYTTSSGRGSVSGQTYGETHTDTTHHCHVSFVK